MKSPARQGPTKRRMHIASNIFWTFQALEIRSSGFEWLGMLTGALIILDSLMLFSSTPMAPKRKMFAQVLSEGFELLTFRAWVASYGCDGPDSLNAASR